MLTEIKNRGVEDVCIVCCDGLKGLPDAITNTWSLAIVQTCVIHLIRNTFRLANRADWDHMAKDLRPVYTAVNETDAKTSLEEFHDTWGDKYPAIKGLFPSAWAEFVPFLDQSPEIRRAIYSTDEIVKGSPRVFGVSSVRRRSHRRVRRARRSFSASRSSLTW